MEDKLFAEYKSEPGMTRRVLAETFDLDKLANLEAVIHFDSAPNRATANPILLALQKQRFEQGLRCRQIAPMQS